MASQQLTKKDREHKQGHAEEEPKVIKIAHHFESLADHSKESDMAIGEAGHGVKGKDSSSYAEGLRAPKITPTTHVETHSNIPSKTYVFHHPEKREEGHEEKGRDTNMGEKEGKKGAQEGQEQSSLEEIGKYRQQAQQNSMDAIRAAEERYAKGNESGGSSLEDVKETVMQGLSKVAEKGAEVKDKSMESARAAAEYVSDKTGIAKDTDETEQDYNTEEQNQDKNQPGLTTAAKDTIVSASKTALGYTLHTAEMAKEYTSHNVVPTVAQVGKTAASYAGSAAVVAKDTGVEVGKTAAGFAGHKAVQAKDVAVETSWRVAHYSLEKAAELTEATANVERKVADLTAQKAEAAQQKAIMKEQQGQESCQEMKQSGDGIEEVGEQGEKWEDVSVDFGQKLSMYSGVTEDTKRVGEQAAQNKDEQGGYLGAIRETLVEIAQSTKDLVIGQEDPSEKNN